MKNLDKLYKSILGLLILGYLIIIFVFNMIMPQRKFSESENRVLQEKPNFSLNKLLKGKYTSDYEKYVADQFPIRDFWIGIKSSAERAIGKKDNNGVYLGKDGYLFQMFNASSEEDFKNKMKKINSFSSKSKEINKYFMLVPNSIKILEDKLPKFASPEDQKFYINKVKESLDKNMNFVDVYSPLMDKKNEYIYYKTDHHWTTKGAYYAYEALASAMNFTPKEEEDFSVTEVSENFYGSMYSKSGFRGLEPDSINLYLPKNKQNLIVSYSDKDENFNSIYAMDNLNKKDKYTVFLDGNYPIVKISTDVKNGKKLLIIKDSYANSFVPFLLNHFNEIYMVDLRFYNENLNDLMGKNNIDNLLILYNVNTFFEDASINNIIG
ncbi:DHHW family protein [uncultured Clostridium sp.]|uniref:DHHW family protein n=1 Tax=uncultured Clostridium sp. TaxID=59620 RepID=UPI0028E537DC|nr:DHHW family protein [uncultured Clostridium sp.]